MSRTIQSTDYVPGVSGWKIDTDTGAFELASSGVAVLGADPKAVYCGKSRKESQKPFIVVDGVTYIRQGFIDDATVTKALITQECSARAAADAAISSRVSSIEVSLGQLQSQFVVDADRFSFNDRIASEILHDIRAIIGETSLGQELKKRVAQIDGSVSAAVKEVIRAELKPGGLLHRSI